MGHLLAQSELHLQANAQRPGGETPQSDPDKRHLAANEDTVLGAKNAL